MKHLLVLIFAGLSSFFSQAQSFYAGIRTGASYWMNHQINNGKTNTIEGQHITWDKDFFVNYQSKKRWSFELSGEQYAFNQGVINETYGCDYNALYNTYAMWVNRTHETSQNYAIRLSILYHLSCPQIESKCKIMARLHNYLGISISSVFSKNITKYGFEESEQTKSIQHETTFWTGIQHILKFDLSKNLSLNSYVLGQVNPMDLFSNHSISQNKRNVRMNVALGIGYRL
ncbi:MAG: hypothetical protein JST52_00780 [Bacteroidetes bacterium]|nr:hypothetical protein [Bacteroidota bacterium]MBS1740335.1 hypothetical protein [Bacteroidota bacterium]MBS1776843.1 hypothetical protein [Bacteroidota bacterium]